MKKSILSINAIGAFIEESLKMYVADSGNTIITDIHLQLEPETGELIIFNDDDLILSEAIVEEWQEKDDVYTVAEQYIRNALVALHDSGKLDTLGLLKPYSFVLIDGKKETISELFIHAECFGNSIKMLELYDGIVCAHLFHLFAILDINVSGAILFVVLNGEAIAWSRTLAAQTLHLGTNFLYA